MSGTTLTIDGLADLLRAMEQMSAASQKSFHEAAKVAAQPTVDAAKRTVPVKSGALRDTIRSSPSTRGVRIRAGSARVPYAAAVHFGHKRSELNTRYRFRRADIKGNPFLFRAVDATKDKVIATYMAEIQRLWESL